MATVVAKSKPKASLNVKKVAKEDLVAMVKRIKGIERLHGKSLIETRDFTTEELTTLLDLCDAMQRLDFYGKRLDMIPPSLFLALFFDKSTRTKTSWAGAAARLGGIPVILEGSSTQVAHGETPIETGAMMGMNAHAIGIRHDMIIGEGNTFIRETKAGIDEYLKHTGAKRHVPFVNLQCDIDHPTQAMADLAMMRQHFGGNLKGKKFVISWAYSPSYAKPLSVPQGLITLLTRFGMDVVLAYPEGYNLMDRPMKDAKNFSNKSGGTFEVVHDMKAAVRGADIVYAKSWGPYDMMLERVKLNKARDEKALKELEGKMLALNAKYKNWKYDLDMQSTTKKAKYMHCLPADIGAEVDEKLFAQHRMFMYEEANKKPFVIAAAIAASMVPNLQGELIKRAK